MDEKERARALDITLGQIEKQFGKGSILRLGSKDAIVPVSVISTGSISLDAALGVGGVPRGRVCEIYGPESSGKTTIALQVIAEAQKKGGMAAFIDVEHALDPAYARKLGVDVDNLLVSQPDYGEQALEITGALIASGQIDVLVVDSVAALVPKAELDGEMGDSHMGLQARLMSQALRKLTGVVSKSRTCLIFINQIREKIGVMFGNPETTTGGRALKFYASVRLDIRRIAALKDGENVIGNRTKVKVVKNKVAAPFREAEFDLIYGEGISREGDLLDLGAAQNIIEKSGSWFSYKGERIGQGRENARQFLKENTDIRQTIDQELRKALGLIKAEPAPDAAPPRDAAAAPTNAFRGRHPRAANGRQLPHNQALPTGFAILDRALGIGGLPRGRITETFGPANCGKTALALQSIAHGQSIGTAAVWIDAEHAFDPGFATTLGVDLARLPVAEPAWAEEALEMTRRLAASGAIDLVVVDSAAALVPQLEMEAGMAVGSASLQSRVLGSELRRLVSVVRRSGVAILFLNQTRTRLEATAGELETTAGGPSLKLYSAVRIALAATGRIVRFRILKNEMASPFITGELEWHPGSGFAKGP